MADADDPLVEFDLVTMTVRGVEYGLACLPWRGGYAVAATYADGREVKGLVEALEAISWFRAHGLRKGEATEFVVQGTLRWKQYYGDPNRVQ